MEAADRVQLTRNFLSAGAYERAELLCLLPPRDLADWALCFELPWDDRPKAIHYYPQIVAALSAKLRSVLLRLEAAEERLEQGNLCADPNNSACDCTFCQEVAGFTFEEMRLDHAQERREAGSIPTL